MSEASKRVEDLFPATWESRMLGELVDSARPIVYGILMPGYGCPDGVPVIKVKDIRNGRIDCSNLLLTSPKIDNAYRRSRLRTGDLLFSIRGTVGRMALVPESLELANITQDTARICITKGDTQFVKYFLETERVQRFLKVHTLGVAVQGINLGEMRRIPLMVPPLPHQRKIARILTTLDNVITRTEALIAKYQAIKQGLMHDLFTRGVDATGKLRPPQSEAPELYKQSELGWIPKEWEVVRLGEISHRMTNGFVGVATPFYTNDDNGLPYLYGNNVRPDKLELSTFLRVTRAFHESHKKSQLEPGDMLTVQSGHIGTSAIVPDGLGEANCHALIITKVEKAKAFSPFVSAYCNSPDGMARMASIFVGSTILHVNVKELKNFTMPLPIHVTEQKQIRSRIDSLSCSMSAEYSTLIKLKRVKTGLMQDLLTGKVAVKADKLEEITHV